jgi:membrane-bound metal-dependent hydrolase YbcI (DUF457 family)
MNTPTHLLITAVAGDRLKQRGINVNSKAVLLGSIAPDLPLFGLTFGYWIANSINPFDAGPAQLFGPEYDALFFGDPSWIIPHNFLHAPLIILALALLGYVGMRRAAAWGAWLFWFALACGLHSLIDIPTHVNDGPLLLFPFNWSYRFAAPISYWDMNYGARYFAIFENILALALLGYLVVVWLRRRTDASRQQHATGDT